jgi:hypothetical protein
MTGVAKFPRVRSGSGPWLAAAQATTLSCPDSSARTVKDGQIPSHGFLNDWPTVGLRLVYLLTLRRMANDQLTKSMRLNGG